MNGVLRTQHFQGLEIFEDRHGELSPHHKQGRKREMYFDQQLYSWIVELRYPINPSTTNTLV
jgi:hypothetical protein